MKRRVRILPRGRLDRQRLEAFLSEKSSAAAERAAVAIAKAVVSLKEHAERMPVQSELGVRELPVRFGRDGYVIQYRIVGDEVQVARIFYARENR